MKSTILLLLVVFLQSLSALKLINGVLSCKCNGMPYLKKSKSSHSTLFAVLPGDPLVTGTLTQGVSNVCSLFSNVILARFALSWFPQIPKQFPILRPIFTVTEPYLTFFRRQIPPIGGFDLSGIPAILMLDILSQTVVAVGAEIPDLL